MKKFFSKVLLIPKIYLTMVTGLLFVVLFVAWVTFRAYIRIETGG